MADVDSPTEGNNPEIEAAAPERPEWLPANFNDPADLAKSYQSAQAELTRAKQEAAAERAAREAIEAQQAEVQQQYQAQTQQNDLLARYQDALENGDAQTLAALNFHIAQEAAKQQFAQFQPQQQASDPELVAFYAETSLREKHQDWMEYRNKVVSAIEADPDLFPDTATSSPAKTAAALERVYKLVKADEVLSNPQQAHDLASAKEVAQTMSGAGVRQPAPSDRDEWARQIAEANKTLGGFSTL